MRKTITITCSNCNKEAKLEQWYVLKRKRLGQKRFYCNYSCFKSFQKTNPEQTGMYKDGLWARDKKEYGRKRYQENRDILLEQSKKIYEKNKDRISEKNKKNRKQIRDKRKYLYNNNDRYRASVIASRHRRRKNLLKHGELKIETVQMVYEDNIKKYGTLTCYLCNELIKFGKDSLEHKTPVSRGGTNEYENLAIACQSCNCKKHTKTLTEYLETQEV